MGFWTFETSENMNYWVSKKKKHIYIYELVDLVFRVLIIKIHI